jgi:hypothetical protein
MDDDDDIWFEAGERAERAENKPGMTPYRRGLGELFIEPLTAVIAAKLADEAKLPHGRFGTLLQNIEPRVLAALALAAVLPQIGRPLRPGDEASFKRAIKEAAGELFYANVHLTESAKAAKTKEDRQRARWRAKVMKGKVKVGRSETPKQRGVRLHKARRGILLAFTREASRLDSIKAGTWLLNRAIEADIVILVGKQLLPVRKYEEDILRLQRLIVRRNVHLLPSATKPAPWTKSVIYRSGVRRRFMTRQNPKMRAKIDASFRNPRFRLQHLAAVNTLGDVPLQIDEWTLRLVERFAAHVKKYKDEDRRLADASLIVREIETAARLGIFYNSYRIDFRGRLNAEQTFNYAQQDRVRSLYRFAQGVPIDDLGLTWLKVHVANCHGETDKRSYENRVAWTDEHYDEIERVAVEPERLEWWRSEEVDAPFCFAAACRELVNALDNPNFITAVPCAFDHTASGLQHLALIGLDEKTAPLVNLTDSTAPHDIYGLLAGATEKLFDDSPEAQFWRDLFKKTPRNVRKLLKHPGMTFSYASTDRGNIRQVADAYYDIYDEDAPFDHVRYLVSRFRQACKKELPGPAGIMEYVQSLVSDCNKRKRFLEWTSPSGLLVGNIYPKRREPDLYTLEGSKHIVSEEIPGTIDAQKARSAASANYVHSLDAAHLVRIVNALAANQMPTLCVHDSFAVLAPHAEQFHITNREELALMYHEMFEQGGPLALLRQHNDEIDDAPPPSGKFNLWEVQKATYACS